MAGGVGGAGGGFSGGGAARGYMGATGGGAQKGRTQNKSMAEIMRIAPPPQPPQLVPTSTGVRPGDLAGTGAVRPQFHMPNTVVTDKGEAYGGADMYQMGKNISQAYNKVFGPGGPGATDPLTGQGPVDRWMGRPNVYPEEYPGGLSRGYQSAPEPLYPAYYPAQTSYGGAY